MVEDLAPIGKYIDKKSSNLIELNISINCLYRNAMYFPTGSLSSFLLINIGHKLHFAL
jgi:hypothetical protein